MSGKTIITDIVILLEKSESALMKYSRAAIYICQLFRNSVLEKYRDFKFPETLNWYTLVWNTFII